jgi:hypothetical protein
MQRIIYFWSDWAKNKHPEKSIIWGDGSLMDSIQTMESVFF